MAKHYSVDPSEFDFDGEEGAGTARAGTARATAGASDTEVTAAVPKAPKADDASHVTADEPLFTVDPNLPAPDELPRERRRRSASRRRGARRAVKVLVGIVLVLGLAAGGVAWAVRASVERGRAAFQESMQKVMEQSSNTIQYEGKTYALNEHMVTVAFIGFDNNTENKLTGDAVSGQSDTVMVVALNTETGKATGIVIPRDSMVAVDTYVDGSYAGQSTMQLCLQYAYGSSPEQSSQLVADCVSRVLGGMPVDYYFTLNVDGVSALNDAVGGVSLTATQSVPKAGVTEGQQATLYGSAAEAYVRWRDTSDPSSSLKRGARQVSYLKAFTSKVLAEAKSNPASLVSLYQTAQDYTWTNLGLDEFSYLATTMLDRGVTSFDIVTLGGTMGDNDKYAEFTLDQDDVQRRVVETFYHEVGDAAADTARAAVTTAGTAE